MVTKHRLLPWEININSQNLKTKYAAKYLNSRRMKEVILQDEKLHDPYESPCIVRTMKSRRLQWHGHTARVVRGWGQWTLYRIWWGILLNNGHLENQKDGRIVWRRILGNYVVTVGSGWNWFRTVSDFGLWYYGSCEPSGSAFKGVYKIKPVAWSRSLEDNIKVGIRETGPELLMLVE